MGADTEGFTDGVGEFGGASVDGLAVELVGVAGVVAEGGGDLGDVFGEGDGVGLAVVPSFDCGKSGGMGIDCDTKARVVSRVFRFILLNGEFEERKSSRQVDRIGYPSRQASASCLRDQWEQRHAMS